MLNPSLSPLPFHTYSATALVEGLQSQKWSSETLTRYFLQRIETFNPDLHAIHFVNARAIAEAQAMDARRAQGESLPPLAGLPMTLKDAFAVAGERTTYGLWLYKNHHSKKDAQVVASLKGAGLIFLGRSAVPTASFDWNCRNQLFPECVHPEQPDYSPGGSSGGAATALVAGLTPLELGSDLGGSIRYPAHCCGIYGIRLSEGWVPFGDVGPNGQSSFRHLGACGPMANHLSDLSLVLDLFAKDFPDSRLKPLTSAAESLQQKPLRIAYSYDLAGLPCDAATRSALQTQLQRLQSLQLEAGDGPGAIELIEAQPPIDFEALNHAFGEVVGYQYQQMFSRWIPALLKQQALDQVLFKKVGPGWMRDGLLRGLVSREAEFLQALALARSAQQEMDRFFKDVDLWMLPVSASATRLRSESGTRMQTHAGEVTYSDFVGSYLCCTSMLGTPAVTLPMGRDEKQLPLGMQIHGPRFADRQVLALLNTLFV